MITWLARSWLSWVERRELAARIRRALPNGTRVRLTCHCKGYGQAAHEGTWTTEYKDLTDDYLLTREADGETTYAARNAIQVLA